MLVVTFSCHCKFQAGFWHLQIRRCIVLSYQIAIWGGDHGYGMWGSKAVEEEAVSVEGEFLRMLLLSWQVPTSHISYPYTCRQVRQVRACSAYDSQKQCVCMCSCSLNKTQAEQIVKLLKRDNRISLWWNHELCLKWAWKLTTRCHTQGVGWSSRVEYWYSKMSFVFASFQL